MAKIEIANCDQCPYAKITNVYTPDPFESVRQIFCTLLHRNVYNYLDWNDDSPVPKVCPFNKEV